MNSFTLTEIFNEPPVDEAEILRYAGCKTATDGVRALLAECLDESRGKLCYRVCYRVLAVDIRGDECDFGLFSLRSEKLAENLCGCKSVIVFAATVGLGMDRLIARYTNVAPSKAHMLQAIGSERVEALCDAFCEDTEAKTGKKLRPRFSPGYGDLALSVQRDVFAVLGCEKYIGITLNGDLLMSPSKSVTAFVGIGDEDVSQRFKERKAEK